MKIIEEIKAIQARFAKHARKTHVNGYSESLTFDVKFILQDTRMSINDAIATIYNQTGVRLKPVIDPNTGKTDHHLFTARITGRAKDHDETL